ncbi:glycosyl hydrolase family 71 protein [Aspergillus heteromorphus CBS 117.55]|uniref:Glycosyl hydrolase family 71 protein n=1 Tax=Aspergillus heteromorphus CBS 117.55 TaxID=1448321 RepID=A0A317WSV9_9EURO|nr:glycosyl hydrolase family 71 protein [Aspergillus heteromorphus CBS 117.55]PWY89185.1 glycosyl hydrolase family 71 protein [Aspergillus heteromorphus CBS 117.55]
MMSFAWLLLALVYQVQAKAVFAHFMLANSANFTKTHWEADITAAKAAHIDAFALNTAYGAANATKLLNDAFAVASDLDFKLFLSFDYSAGGWPADQVTDWLKNYTTHPAYFTDSTTKHPLVSTFEGYQATGDWSSIKSKVNVSLIPDWSTKTPAQLAALSVVDGLMSWSAWPYGSDAMNTTSDQEYMTALKAHNKAYIMPVSPWFYTDMVRYDKNWVWQGDDLWYTRWQQVIQLQPEYVEIITWNDFGESHYIGPLHENELGIFQYGGSPFNYAENYPHDGWRLTLPYVIDQFKNGSAEVEDEGVVVWYRLTPGSACPAGQTTGNTESQNQNTMPPGDVLLDKVFFSALLDEEADVAVSIGGKNQTVQWGETPKGGKGVYHGNLDMDNRTGEVVVTLSRDGKFVAQVTGESITKDCPHKLTNWNAWVGSSSTNISGNASTSRASLDKSGAGSSRGVTGLLVVLGLWMFWIAL